MFESSENEIFTINHTTIETSWIFLKNNSNSFQRTSTNSINNRNTSSVTEDRWFVFNPSLALWILKAIAMSLLISLTILGNLLVVFGVARSARLRTPSYFLIVNLAVADLLLGVAVLPISAARELFDFQLNPILCSLWSSLDVLCCTASILSLCALAGERYLGVSRPLRRARVLGGARARAALLGAPWAAAALIALAAPLAWPGGEEGDSCTVNKHLGYVIFSACGSFYIPAAAMLLLWWKVYRAAVGRSARLNGARMPNGGMRAHRGGAPLQTQSIKESSGRRSRRSSGWTSSEFEEPSVHMKILSRGRLSRSCSTPTETLALKNDSSSKTIDNPSKKFRHNSESSPPKQKTECQMNCPNFETNRPNVVDYNNSNLELQEINKPKRFQKLNCLKKNQNENIGEFSSDNQTNTQKNFDDSQNDTNSDCFKHVTTKNKNNTIVHVVKCSKYCPNCSSNARKISKEGNENMSSACSLEFESQDVLRTLNCADQRRFSKSAKFPRRSPSCRSDSRVVMSGSLSMSKSVSSFRSKRLSWSFRHSSSIRSEQSRQGTIGSHSRAARTMALVVGGFLLCWCPFFIILPIDAACPSCDVGTAFTLAFWLGYFNSCINPFIYACSSREMRRAFRAILCRRKYTRAMSLRM